MKKLFIVVAIAIFALGTQNTAVAQTPGNTLVHVTKLKMLRPENGNFMERDSLIEIYNNNVIKKNKYILSHRQYGHFFTGDSQDYMIVEEYKDFDSWQLSRDENDKLEKAAWPDEEKAKEFFKAMDRYFENWHGDMLMNYNPKLSKN